jgi:uncharacterized membrane protein YphA (DoxX/SURF4 family)
MVPDPIAIFMALPPVIIASAIVFWMHKSNEQEREAMRRRGLEVDEAKQSTFSYKNWILAGLVAFVFLSAGAPKLGTTQEVLQSFEEWGYPQWMLYAVGAIEYFGGIFLMLPWATFWSAIALSVVMLGAIFTHIATGAAAWAVVPTLMLAALAFLAYRRRPSFLGGPVEYREIWNNDESGANGERTASA